MKTLFISLLLAACSATSSAAEHHAEPAPGPKPAPHHDADPVALDEIDENNATLKVGNAAPAIKFSKFYKGTAIAKIDPTKTYIFECWASWCGPCVGAFPHLSEIAKKTEGKVTVVGINVWERLDADKVQAFVDKQADKMSYNVAGDTAEGFFAAQWLTAAGQSGIPCAFVVVKGKIAWIGHPNELDSDTVLGLADGTITAAQLAKMSAAKEAEMNLIEQEFMTKIQPMLEGGDTKNGLAAIKKLAEAHPKAGLESMIDNLQTQIDAQDNPGAVLDKIAKMPANVEAEELFKLLGPLVSAPKLPTESATRLLAEIDSRIGKLGKDIPASADEAFPFIILRFMKADVLAKADKKDAAVKLLNELKTQVKGDTAQAAVPAIDERLQALQGETPAEAKHEAKKAATPEVHH